MHFLSKFSKKFTNVHNYINLSFAQTVTKITHQNKSTGPTTKLREKMNVKKSENQSNYHNYQAA